MGHRVQQTASGKVPELYHDIIPSDADVNVPSWDDIRREQQGYPMPQGIRKDHDRIFRKGKKVWISREARERKLKIPVRAHCGQEKYRGNKKTETRVKEIFEWEKLSVEVREFVQSFIH